MVRIFGNTGTTTLVTDDRKLEEISQCIDELARLNDLVGKKEDYDSGGMISNRFEYLYGRSRDLYLELFKEEL